MYSPIPKNWFHYTTDRDALFRNPTLEAATLWWRGANPKATLLSPLTPLAAVHKARLQWLDATDEMLAESKAWLAENNFKASTFGVEPLTPKSRDAYRAVIGKPPLREQMK